MLAFTQSLNRGNDPYRAGWFVVSGRENHGVDGPHDSREEAEEVRGTGERVVYGRPKGNGTSEVEVMKAPAQ